MSWALKQKVSSERGRRVKSRDHRPGPYVKIIGAVYGGGGGVYGINAWQAVEVMEGLSEANMSQGPFKNPPLPCVSYGPFNLV